MFCPRCGFIVTHRVDARRNTCGKSVQETLSARSKSNPVPVYDPGCPLWVTSGRSAMSGSNEFSYGRHSVRGRDIQHQRDAADQDKARGPTGVQIEPAPREESQTEIAVTSHASYPPASIIARV